MRYDNRILNWIPGLTLNLAQPYTFHTFTLDDCELNQSCIDIWHFSLSNFIENSYSFLNTEERNRADRFHFARHHQHFTMARAMMRIILSRYLKCKPQELEFNYAANGKPLEKNNALQFNLSHSGTSCLLAVGKHYELGVDIENFSIRPYQGIAKNLFSVQEFQQLEKAPSYMQASVFFKVWAQKEAFIKASGFGLSYPTQQFTVFIMGTEPYLIFDHILNKNWQMLAFTPTVASAGALCFDADVTQISKLTLTEQQRNLLINDYF